MSIFGTRPEMIKLWSTLKKLDELNFEHVMVHTGQNFTPELKDFFFRDLKLRKPDYRARHRHLELRARGRRRHPQVGRAVREGEARRAADPRRHLQRPLRACRRSHRGIKIFHMEAGLRAWDKRMPEQRNRILIDHMSDILLPVQPLSPREPDAREHPSRRRSSSPATRPSRRCGPSCRRSRRATF